MIDQYFIDEILRRGSAAKEKVRSEFSGLSVEQLNKQPATGGWSIGQCLEHLINSHAVYFPLLKEITEGNYKKRFWEKISPFSSMWGRMMKDQLGEEVKRKMKAPKKIKPILSKVSATIVDDYLRSLDTFLNYISTCSKVDIDRTVITSPLMSIITYNLRDGFQFLIQHEHRHINQAMRVLGK